MEFKKLVAFSLVSFGLASCYANVERRHSEEDLRLVARIESHFKSSGLTKYIAKKGFGVKQEEIPPAVSKSLKYLDFLNKRKQKQFIYGKFGKFALNPGEKGGLEKIKLLSIFERYSYNDLEGKAVEFKAGLVFSNNFVLKNGGVGFTLVDTVNMGKLDDLDGFVVYNISRDENKKLQYDVIASFRGYDVPKQFSDLMFQREGDVCNYSNNIEGKTVEKMMQNVQLLVEKEEYLFNDSLLAVETTQ